MGSAFPDFAFMHDNDMIRMLNGGKSVSHHDGCPAFHEVGQGLGNQAFGFGIDIGSCFIQHQNSRVKS